MNEEKDLKPFYQECADEFYDYLCGIKVSLRKSNSEYARLYEERRQILDSNPNLHKIIEEETLENGLSTAECMAFSKLLLLHYDMQDIEAEELFFAGSMNAYYYFRDIGIIE